MAEIQVLFEKPDASGKINIVVLNESQPVLVTKNSVEPVHWHFQVEEAGREESRGGDSADVDRKLVDRVVITFDDPHATYFLDPDTKKPTHTCTRWLAEGDTIYGRPPARNHPDHEETDDPRRLKMHGYRDKYTIFGYKGSSETAVAVKDPEIVPIRP